jgi:tetratricopeptide (TPR) repeat protein
VKATGAGWILALAGLAATVAGGALLAPADRALLQEPWTIRLDDGQEIRGRLAGADAETLRFRRILEGGEVLVGIHREEIESLRLPGQQVVRRAGEAVRAGDWPAARARLAALYEQRRVALDLLPDWQADLLSFLPRAQLATGATAAAVSVAGELLADATTPATVARLREIRLLGHYRLQLHEEARALAHAERAKGPRYRDSALPDLVLALLAFREGRLEDALGHCLRPIVFSGPHAPRYLPACYALAMVATAELGERNEQEALDTERRQRGLPWHPPPALSSGTDLPANGRLTGVDGDSLPLRPPAGEETLPYVPVRDHADLLPFPSPTSSHPEPNAP